MIEFKARVQYDFSTDEKLLLTRIRDHRENKLYAVKCLIEKMEFHSPSVAAFIEPSSFASDSSPIISNEQFIQGVLDAAWEFGFRPIGYKDTQKETEALRAHLEDMQKIVMNSKAVNWK